MQNIETRKEKLTDNQNNIQAISSIIMQNYVEGGRKGDSVIMRPAFHKNATIHGHVNGSLLAGPIQLLFNWVDENQPAVNLKATIVNIDLVNTIATARVELTGWLDNQYTDQFTLLKENNKWTITSKVFHLY